MAIEFYCPGCGDLMSTPDATAGGKGRCPYCQTKVRIPLTSMLKGATTAVQSIFDFDPNTGSGPTSVSPGYIRFRCSECQTDLRIPSTNAGKKGQCPHCNAVMQIPAAAAASMPAKSTAAEKKAPSEKWKVAPNTPAAGNLQFSCPSCRNVVQVSAAAAGKRGKCPRCQSVIQIPFSSDVSSSGLQPLGPMPSGLTLISDDAVSGLTPLDDGVTGLTPLDNGGLTPLGDFGLTPLGGTSGGLEALGPLDTGPYNSLPAGNYAYSQQPANFGGSAGNSVNPFASPSASSYAASTPRPVDKRRGLPWDQKGAAVGAFFSTVSEVLLEPTEAFVRMKRYGGLGRPFVFYLTTLLIHVLANTLYIGLWYYFDPFDLFEAELGVPDLLVITARILGIMLLSATANAFVTAGIWHRMLKLTAGTELPFETSFRVYCYAQGAVYMLQVVPILGHCIGAIYSLILPVIALAAACSISISKSITVFALSMVISVVIGILVSMALEMILTGIG